MVAIITKWVGPTNYKPSRIIVKSEAGKVGRIVVSWDHALDVEANHKAAADEYVRRNEWDQDCYGTIVGGAIEHGYAFVFVKQAQCERCNAADLARAVGPAEGAEAVRARIILDNGGGLVLHFGNWAHSYEGHSNASIAQRAATDIRAWLATGNTRGWDGHDETMVNLTADRSDDIINIDRSVDTVASLATELRETAGAMAIALATALESDPSR